MAKTASHHRRIANGFLVVGFFVLIGKLAGAAKEMAIAWRYGVSETVDAYVLIFNLVNWPVSIWFSVLTVILVPLVARIKQEDPADLPLFAGELLGFSLACGLVMAVLAVAGATWVLGKESAGLTPAALVQARSMVGPLSVLLPLGLVISVIAAWTMALGQHRNTLLEAVPSLVLLSVLLLPGAGAEGPLVWGTVAGCAVHALWLIWPLWFHRSVGRPRISFESPAWRYFWAGTSIMVAGQALTTFAGIIDQFFAVVLGPGAISILSYATRILTLILGLGAIAVSRATLPVFSELSANGGGADAHALAVKWAKIIFLVGLFALGIAWLLAPWGVDLLFQRGAFGTDDTANVALIFRYLAIQIPFYFSSLVLIAYFSALGKYRIVAFSGAANLAIKAVLLSWLAPKYGLVGVALSSVLMYVCSLIFFLILMRRIGAARILK